MPEPRQRILGTLLAAATFALAAVAGCQTADTRTGEPTLTALLLEYEGPEAVESARRLAGELKAQGLQEVFTVEGDQYASVCAGRFDSWKDPEADRMLHRIRRIRDAQGQYPFVGVVLMPVPEPLPKNPWPLRDADGQYTLIVASWQNPGRMARAQAYARDLRAKGHEAYVYHGPSKSTVSVGAFGPEIFDDASKVGRPDARPRIVAPEVRRLQQQFPSLVLEGETAPPEAKLRPYIGIIPGRRPAAVPPGGPRGPLYRVTLSLVETETGLAVGQQRASGVAQGPNQLPWLIGVLVRQVMQAVEPGRAARVGVAGVAADADAARAGVETLVLEALPAALGTAGAGKIRLYSHQGTLQILQAQGLAAERVLQDHRVLKGLEGLDYVLVASVRRQM